MSVEADFMVAKSKQKARSKIQRSNGRLTPVKSPRLQPTRPGAKGDLPKTPGQGPNKGEVIDGPALAAAAEVEYTTMRERYSYDGDTAIKLYLREIGQVKLLTPQEE